MTCDRGTGLPWGVYECDDGTFHVKPMQDYREHDWVGCWCHPFLDDHIHVHNSMDRREFIERGESRMQ